MDSKIRFSNRVEQYVKYRPGYPAEGIDLLFGEAGFPTNGTIADVGSGTGKLTELLLERGPTVYAVEPNADMRLAAETLLRERYSDRYISVGGSAERTELAERSVDAIAVAQAFHWFDLPQTRKEFARVLKPDGPVALIWNKRRVDSDAFAEEYDRLLFDYASDYDKVKHTRLGPEQYGAFFRDGDYTLRKFANRQLFNMEELAGRTASSSYTPLPGDERYAAFKAKLEELYARHERDGRVAFEYETEVYYGQIG
ncbi:class I SAM-dependent methyltransferase [Paenibacillus sp. GCM10027626]|uniref:class I SAM-dependent methyltransferase n=1 Tax=Paenibacillus sp. GCM10027626 TaxID=3273411 RepID=UPI0036458F6D